MCLYFLNVKLAFIDAAIGNIFLKTLKKGELELNINNWAGGIYEAMHGCASPNSVTKM